MRQFLMWIGISVGLALLFIVGLIFQQPFLLMSGVCLWTPAAWMVGFAFARAGGRVSSPVNLDRQPQKKPVSRTEFS
jgi:hypothetical protein